VWYLIEDFFEQSWIMKLFAGWGWLAVLIMVSSFIDAQWPIVKAFVSGLFKAHGTG